MFSNSLAAAPLSVVSQNRVRAGISPPQCRPRAVLACIVRFSAWLVAVANVPLLGCVGRKHPAALARSADISSACLYVRVVFSTSSVRTTLYTPSRL